MKRPTRTTSRLLCCLLFLLSPALSHADEPTPADTAAFNAYIAATESRLTLQHRSRNFFLAPPKDPNADSRLRAGNLLIENLTPQQPTSTALLHHWRATAFAPNATAADLEALLRNFPAYPHIYAPQVTEAHILSQTPDTILTTLRLHQHHVLTVNLDTTYNVTFARLDSTHAYSLSRSTHIAELDANNHPTTNHGFLWRSNTYWSWEERDNGLYLQLESVTLTRSIPRGLNWAVIPFTESIPRDSLQFTLTSTLTALKK